MSCSDCFWWQKEHHLQEMSPIRQDGHHACPFVQAFVNPAKCPDVLFALHMLGIYGASVQHSEGGPFSKYRADTGVESLALLELSLPKANVEKVNPKVLFQIVSTSSQMAHTKTLCTSL